MTGIQDLPADVARLTLGYLDDEDLARACMVNKNFNQRICNSQFWLLKIKEKYPELSRSDIDKYRKNNSYWSYYLNLADRTNKLSGNLDKDLIKSSQKGWIDLVSILIKQGADIHVRNDSPLKSASYNGHTKIVKLLLERGADVHADNDKALIWASLNGHTDTVKLLLEKGADVHANNDAALRYASNYGHTETVKLLLEYGANPDVLN